MVRLTLPLDSTIYLHNNNNNNNLIIECFFVLCASVTYEYHNYYIIIIVDPHTQGFWQKFQRWAGLFIFEVNVILFSYFTRTSLFLLCASLESTSNPLNIHVIFFSLFLKLYNIRFFDMKRRGKHNWKRVLSCNPLMLFFHRSTIQGCYLSNKNTAGFQQFL